MKKTGVVVLLLVLVVVAIIAHISTTDVEFSRYNVDWAGTSGFFADLDSHDAEDLRAYNDLGGRDNTLLLIIAPNTSFSPDETAALKEFIENGNNTVLITDETGISNDLLAGLGSRIRVKAGDICSAEMEFWDYSTVIAYPHEDDPLLANVSSLVLNQASSVTGGEVLVRTTLISWDDTNMNSRPDGNETLMAYGILSRETMGNGTLYVLSDPSIFINGMRKARLSGDNEVFIANLLSLHPDIIVEQVHSLTAGTDPVLAGVLFVKNTMVIKISALIISVLLVAVAFWRRWI